MGYFCSIYLRMSLNQPSKTRRMCSRLLRHERRENPKGDFMFSPYKRIIVMHLTIIFCAGITMFSGNNIFALIGLITIKTFAALWAHLKERQRFSRQGQRF